MGKAGPVRVEGSTIANGNGEIELSQVMEFPEEEQPVDAPRLATRVEAARRRQVAEAVHRHVQSQS